MNDVIEFENWRIKNGFTIAEEKLKVYYSMIAFVKTIELVKAHSMEVGWNMTVTKYKDGYRVNDIFVYPQKASSAYISVDPTEWGIWKAGLDDVTEQYLNGHGHSHVNMSTFSSPVDELQQHDEILTKKNGFYLFQIWNKRNEVNSFFYDLDHKIYYPEVELIVEETDSFIKGSFNYVRKGACK